MDCYNLVAALPVCVSRHFSKAVVASSLPCLEALVSQSMASAPFSSALMAESASVR